MDGLEKQISLFSYRIRMCLFALLGVIVIATVLGLTLDKGALWVGIEGINLGFVSGEEIVLDDEMDLPELPDHLFYGDMILLVVTVLFYGLLIFQLERLFAAYQRGELFTPMNARRIRNVGLLFCGAALIGFLDSLNQLYLMQELMAVSADEGFEDGWEIVSEVHLPIPFLLGGLAIILIARVMEKGALLQDEMDHLI
ncbi:DUF2975 domain-containing protein [Kiloniella sp. EL199]|uniref:DUF2975 domain-containing protein n=1 Tax=Kiloniella sp. EL199 TaxID=2107581 RepID=UPI0013C50795|nr:DUF2975 domain-containing protein [Kiloniella sp. EL199]